MNNSFYNLAFDQFDKQSLRVSDGFESKDHKQMMDRLNYLTEVRGIGVFTASPGMGKSFTLHRFESSLNRNLYDMKYICLSTVSVADFYKEFCEQLGLDTKGGKTVMFRSIQERLFFLYKDKRKPVILAIDEAQYLSAGILKDLKMLMNFNFDSINCFSLILCGETVLNHTLEKPVHEALKQRITVHYDFNGLDADEVAAYIKHKLRVAGGSEIILEDGAISAIVGYSQGNPRLIDNVMRNALLLGAQLQRPTIDSELILSSINEQTLTN